MAVKRKTYLVKRSFQMRLMSRVFGSIFVIVLLLATATFFFNSYSLSSSKGEIRNFLLKITSVGDDHSEQISAASLVFRVKKMGDNIISSLDSLQSHMLWAALGSIIFSLVLVGSVFLLISHRIAGPIYRMERTLQGIQEGDLTLRVVLRDKDELTDLAEQFNQMTASLNQKINLIQQTIIQLQIDVEKESIESELRKKLIEKIGALESLVKQFKVTYS
ncbi:MAG: HAMP domain-containing protein [Spirochaetia bacterium]|nr:HAMP domain-containing protein [Spirochaetia bacterium]